MRWQEALFWLLTVTSVLSLFPFVNLQPLAAQPSAAGVPAEPIAVLYEEPLKDGGAVTSIAASVSWRYIPGGPNGPEVEARLEVPERNMSIRFAVHKNDDGTLPASHLVEVTIDTWAGFPGGHVDEVPRLVLKPSEDARGQALVGAAAKVADGFFWIALSANQNDISSNLALLRNRNWIDLPMVYATGQRAILTFEKSAAGDAIVNQALAAWLQPPPLSAPEDLPAAPQPRRYASEEGAVVEASTLLIDGSEVVVISVEGEFKPGDNKSFVRAGIDAEHALVSFASPGGDVQTGIQIGEAIRLKEFATLVPAGASCASACALAWLAGQPRYMAPGALVGFHAPTRSDDPERRASSVGSAVVGAYLNKLGLPSAAIAYINAKSPDEMQWLTFEDADRLGIYVKSFDEGTPEIGAGPMYSITIPGGLTSQQIVHRLRADPILGGDITEIPPEGSLLPATYDFNRGDTRENVLARMKRERDRVVSEIWSRRSADLPIFTVDELVVLASIVEKETALADERGRVAAVLINRLRLNMRLQTDSTVIYGLFGGTGKPDGYLLTRADLEKPSPYNTYTIDRLPPGPIANPGAASLEAAANPAATRDLFFVRDPDGNGRLLFAETYEEHLQNVARWRTITRVP